MINTKNNEIIEIDHKQVSPRYTIDIYLSSTYVAHLPTFSPIGYRLSRHTRTFTGKHLFFSSSANNHHRSFRNSISSPLLGNLPKGVHHDLRIRSKEKAREITNCFEGNFVEEERKRKERNAGKVAWFRYSFRIIDSCLRNKTLKIR